MTKARKQSVQNPAQHNLALAGEMEPVGEFACTAEPDDVGRADTLRNMMYELSVENLNLAREEDSPARRAALMQAGMSMATGWVRMSEVRDKLRAGKLGKAQS